jgi:hypothetical protein
MLFPVAAAVLVAVSACGGTASTPSAGTSSSGTPSSAPGKAGATSVSGAAHSAKPVKKVKPVPVESNPPGDIPDNLAFVRYVNRSGGYTFTHPEGWAQTGKGSQVRFTDKLNGVTVDSQPGSRPPTVASARSREVAALKGSVPAFRLVSVSAARLPAGSGVHLVFRRNSAPDPVTGKAYRDEVEEYLVLSAGRLVRMQLYGPVGADNVDAYRTMSQSLRTR